MLKKSKFIWMVVLALFMIMDSAMAATPKLVSGTQTLIGDATTWVLILLPIAGGLMIGYCALQKIFADGEASSIAKWNQWIRRILMATALGESGVGLIAVIAAYYK